MENSNLDKLNQFKKLINNSKNITVLTGAGISTLSGIPDFRGSQGVYTKFDGNKLFDLNYFKQNPTYFYENSKEFIYNIDNKKPNIVHTVLAKFENQGKIKAIITQNIDLLHQKAGSKNVIEIHGSPEKHYCLECEKKFSFGEIKKQVLNNKIPKCECGGIIKPKITFFGEMLDSDALNKSINCSMNSDLFIVLGSSLIVQPAAALPSYALRHNAKLIIINKDKTMYDNQALKFENLEKVFEYLDKEFK